ncbi:hypothetical protein LR48_Vigan06g101200 [Vigna angularis]|uniref:Uncharacterized protein n=2 Tax=Phaseolus angularis TaxID=3914 RepID=A0A0L9USK7_PHAAN|nr:uncharacterized protein LOC108334620 [Vigna angularis]KAG2376584.1 uncharacterized protein HKW66_Vig0242140 [Vigna angularis]KOM45706.1 hypothetical protein LR48_Vigan06g101200 [Vigna angularis]BAT99517.1 hypothetical protein VIGAN_10096500 [Vigna angularis var. angularis]
MALPPDTTLLSYWLNWRFFLCALFMLMTMGLASFLIWKYEECSKPRNERRERQRETAGTLYEDETWNTCLKGIHPAWLLAYRIFSFVVLLSLLTTNLVAEGGGIFFFYTQWTFTLVTIYFGFGSCVSIYGCFYKHKTIDGNTVNQEQLDAEQGTYVAPTLDGTPELPNLYKNSNTNQEPRTRHIAGVWGYIFQIIFQTCGGAVVLTDIVFWLVLYPSMTKSDFRLEFMDVCLHSLNAVFLLVEALLNCMRFPVFRFAYFILWTAMFVLFQWIIHACVSLWWPYPFLDLSSPYAALWYIGVGVTHIPCFAVFALIVKLKHLWLSKLFPSSCQFVR